MRFEFTLVSSINIKGIFVYNDFISKLAKNLFFIFLFVILLSKSPEFLTCELIIMFKRSVNTMAKHVAILRGTLPRPEVIGL